MGTGSLQHTENGDVGDIFIYALRLAFNTKMATISSLTHPQIKGESQFFNLTVTVSSQI